MTHPVLAEFGILREQEIEVGQSGPVDAVFDQIDNGRCCMRPQCGQVAAALLVERITCQLAQLDAAVFDDVGPIPQPVRHLACSRHVRIHSESQDNSLMACRTRNNDFAIEIVKKLHLFNTHFSTEGEPEPYASDHHRARTLVTVPCVPAELVDDRRANPVLQFAKAGEHNTRHVNAIKAVNVAGQGRRIWIILIRCHVQRVDVYVTA